jgi:NAD(P)-dependent dehydrogenase (short-subunit alcohol dehydrogenase family)
MPDIALITGGNRGLGRAVAESLAATGTDIVITYRSHDAEAKEVVEALTAQGRRAAAIQLDTTEFGAFASFADRLRSTLREHWGRDSFDVLVNNAGFHVATTLGTTTEDALDQLFAVHVKGVYLLTQQLAPTLADNGRVINLSTGLARFVTVGNAAYAAMKGAVEVLTRYWATELGARGITVNTIAPGPVATDFAQGYIRDSDDIQRAMSNATALGRVAQADDIGPAVAALVSPGAHWITAQRIEASGGFRL